MTAPWPTFNSTPWDTVLLAYLGAGYGAQASKYGAVGDGTTDDTTALGNALSSGYKRVVIPDGTYKISSPITVPSGVELVLTAGATINNTVYNQSAVILSAGSALRGGTISSPSTWDGTNTATAITYAVVYVTGANVAVDGVTLSNVPKVGIGIKDANNVTVRGCHIVGNYPTGQWTGVETNHYGINSDPDTTGTNLIVVGNTIESCVQGVFIGNYGGGVGEAATVTGNLFENCWNHGVYGYGSGYAVGSNAFHRCQIPIALSGGYHTAVGNTIYTSVTTGSDQRDISGISMRDSIGCVVSGNTIKGMGSSASNIIAFSAIDGTVVRDNVCANNTIEITGGTSNAIAMGTSATTCENNVIHDNHIRCIGRANLGCISVAPSSTAYGTRVHDNTIVLTGNSHAIYLSNVDGAIVHDNMVRLEFDNGSAITIGMVALNSATNVQVHDNEFRVSASWGSNITLRAIYEVATVTNGRYHHNFYTLSPTKLAVATPLSLISGSNALIDEQMAGAPALLAGLGSSYRRTDGGASTTLYVKETNSASTTWRAV